GPRPALTEWAPAPTQTREIGACPEGCSDEPCAELLASGLSDGRHGRPCLPAGLARGQGLLCEVSRVPNVGLGVRAASTDGGRGSADCNRAQHPGPLTTRRSEFMERNWSRTKASIRKHTL